MNKREITNAIKETLVDIQHHHKIRKLDTLTDAITIWFQNGATYSSVQAALGGDTDAVDLIRIRLQLYAAHVPAVFRVPQRGLTWSTNDTCPVAQAAIERGELRATNFQIATKPAVAMAEQPQTSEIMGRLEGIESLLREMLMVLSNQEREIVLAPPPSIPMQKGGWVSRMPIISGMRKNGG